MSAVVQNTEWKVLCVDGYTVGWLRYQVQGLSASTRVSAGWVGSSEGQLLVICWRCDECGGRRVGCSRRGALSPLCEVSPYQATPAAAGALISMSDDISMCMYDRPAGLAQKYTLVWRSPGEYRCWGAGEEVDAACRTTGLSVKPQRPAGSVPVMSDPDPDITCCWRMMSAKAEAGRHGVTTRFP